MNHPNSKKNHSHHRKKYNFVRAVNKTVHSVGHTFNKVLNTQLNLEKNLGKSLQTNFLPILILAGGLGALYLIKK